MIVRFCYFDFLLTGAGFRRFVSVSRGRGLGVIGLGVLALCVLVGVIFTFGLSGFFRFCFFGVL